MARGGKLQPEQTFPMTHGPGTPLQAAGQPLFSGGSLRRPRPQQGVGGRGRRKVEKQNPREARGQSLRGALGKRGQCVSPRAAATNNEGWAL